MPKPAIIGWSHGKFGRSESPLPEMMADVARAAIADAGLEPADIDVIHVGVYNNGLSRQGFEAALPGVVFPELALTPAHRHENACATGSTAVFAAHDSIAAVFGEIARQYFDRYGDRSQTLAKLAAKNHANGSHNPLAHMQKDLGFDFCNTVSEENPYVAEPLRRTDCSMVSNGAVALVMAAEDVAASAPRAVTWRGMGNANDFMPLSKRDPLSFGGPGARRIRVDRRSGLRHLEPGHRSFGCSG
ncbi:MULTISPECIES: hypothetical protein [Brevibacterium]|uniref:Acetyl-CoA acetyltransferase n=2 Tax=Brevibacterium antiquum TaxID=234835 RepID=A0A2H1IBE4_9MICO|nr:MULTISPECIES: hypothetical protein [Brevibacterium]SMX72342.1 Acetyl-CoA acetyltransferase [Brevibacterium antiquum CNRZ 918]SMX92026.1 Acetyl-CoA acetyltransferase [Brevibacterium antiquum]